MRAGRRSDVAARNSSYQGSGDEGAVRFGTLKQLFDCSENMVWDQLHTPSIIYL
jgi:hypothetical protein